VLKIIYLSFYFLHSKKNCKVTQLKTSTLSRVRRWHLRIILNFKSWNPISSFFSPSPPSYHELVLSLSIAKNTPSSPKILVFFKINQRQPLCFSLCLWRPPLFRLKQPPPVTLTTHISLSRGILNTSPQLIWCNLCLISVNLI